MLQAIRTRAGSLIVKILFGFLIVSFGIWGIGDIFRNASQDTTIAKVGGRKIRAEELQTALQKALERLRMQTGQSFDMEQAKKLGVVDDVLEQLIAQSLLDQEIAGLRLDVSDDVIRSTIFNDPALRAPNGSFDRARFDQMLATNRMTEDQFVVQLRQGLPRSQLVHAVTGGVTPPQTLLDALYRYQNEKRVADIVRLPAAKAPDPGQPSETDLRAFYDAHQDQFRAPEYRGFTLASLAPSDVAASVKVSDEQLQDAYKDHEDEFQVPERRQVEQILGPSEAKAKEAEAALASGRDWKEVATKIAGQPPDTIELGLVTRQELPPALADAAFELQLNKPGQPVKGPLGWHILRVVKIEPGGLESFDKAKPQLREKLVQTAALDKIYQLGNQLDDALAGGASLDEAAQKFGLKLSKLDAVDETDKDPAGKPVALPFAADEILKVVFGTEQGRTSRVTDAESGGIFVARVDKVVPPRVRPLAEVKDKAVAGWQAEQRQKAVVKEAEALKAAVAPGSKLAAAASAKGLAATSSPPLGRNPREAQGLPPALVARLFSAKPGEVVTSSDGAGAYVAQLDKVEAPQPGSAKNTAELSGELTQSLQGDLAAEFTTALRQRFPVEIRRDALDKIF